MLQGLLEGKDIRTYFLEEKGFFTNVDDYWKEIRSILRKSKVPSSLNIKREGYQLDHDQIFLWYFSDGDADKQWQDQLTKLFDKAKIVYTVGDRSPAPTRYSITLYPNDNIRVTIKLTKDAKEELKSLGLKYHVLGSEIDSLLEQKEWEKTLDSRQRKIYKEFVDNGLVEWRGTGRKQGKYSLRISKTGHNLLVNL